MKWKLRFGAVAGHTLEFYDVAIFAAISSYLSAELTRLGYQQATEMVWGIFALRFSYTAIRRVCDWPLCR
ncbi:hypothetical protein AB6F55_02490 [Providencia hangzhouensis]